MALDVLMPVIGEAGEEAVVTAWMVDEGSRVTAGQLIAEVQAEKVAEDVVAPADGVVGDLVAINEPVAQGGPICRIFAEDERPGPESGTYSPSAREAVSSSAPGPVAASPAAKRLARELGVDLHELTGTGPGGRITESDVVAAAPRAPDGSAMTGLRAVIARNMRESARTAAAVTLTTLADVTDTVPDHITAWVVKAAADALADHPAMNGTRDGDRFVPGDTVNVALAIQTDEGLTAPVLHDVASKTVEQLSAEIAALAERARTRDLDAEDFRGGTFSITSLGAHGVDGFTPIINPPQLAILGVGAIRTVPGFDSQGAVVARRQMTLSLTFDHAFIDGAPAAEFLAAVRSRLEDQS